MGHEKFATTKKYLHSLPDARTALKLLTDKKKHFQKYFLEVQKKLRS